MHFMLTSVSFLRYVSLSNIRMYMILSQFVFRNKKELTHTRHINNGRIYLT